jgi:hypothetical protein
MLPGARCFVGFILNPEMGTALSDDDCLHKPRSSARYQHVARNEVSCRLINFVGCTYLKRQIGLKRLMHLLAQVQLALGAVVTFSFVCQSV